jgi:hypothetical protein
MFLRDWRTEGLSNLSRTEIVRTTSSKECGSALMMAITASSSYRLSRVKEEGESDLITLICSSTLLMSESRDSESSFWMDRSV